MIETLNRSNDQLSRQARQVLQSDPQLTDLPIFVTSHLLVTPDTDQARPDARPAARAGR